MSGPTPLDVLRQFADSDGLPHETVVAVAELVEAGRQLRMNRAGVSDANAMFVAPVIAKADAEAFVAALAKFGGAA